LEKISKYSDDKLLNMISKRGKSIIALKFFFPSLSDSHQPLILIQLQANGIAPFVSFLYIILNIVECVLVSSMDEIYVAVC
jgi:hypothetical protein